MPNRKTVLKSLLLGLVAVGFGFASVSRTHARPEYLQKFLADPYRKADWTQACATCHVDPAGGGARNAFGKAFQAAKFKITDDMRRAFPDRFNDPDMPKASFVEGSASQVVVEIRGKKWLLDTETKTMTLQSAPAETQTADAGAKTDAPEPPEPPENVYRPMDDKLINLPTARAIPRNALFVNFSHRFPLNEDRSFGGFFGLDGFSNSSLGFIYGITDRVHVGFNRSPTLLGRPIEFFGGVQLADEMKGDPVSANVRVGVEASNNFTINYATSISGTVTRSLNKYVQVTATPTVTFKNRPLLAQSPVDSMPGVTTFALGAGLSVRFRPSLAFIIEANQRLVGKLETRRPSFGFGIMKSTSDGKHSFALTFNNSPGFTTAQRSGTRGTIFGPNSADDTFRGLSIGFNITRRLF